MSIAAYKRTIRATDGPREIERRVLSRVTADLEALGRSYDAAPMGGERLSILSSGLRDALAENQRVWAALRYDLAQPGNALPEALRAQLLSLALFVERQSTAIMGGATGVGTLIEINGCIVAGLSAAQQPALEEA